MEQNEAIFNGCKHLDFGDNYIAEKNLINLGGTTKVVWNRKKFVDHVDLVQFCKLRGRLNAPQACHCESEKMCSSYEDHEHHVINIAD